MDHQEVKRGRPRKEADAEAGIGSEQVEVGRARVSREVAERRARRARSSDLTGYRLKLHIPEEQKEPGFVYRWVNDDGMRVHGLTEGDFYEVAPGIEPRRVGTKPDGSALMAYAVRKPEDWAKEDRAKRQKAVDRQMEAISQAKRGQTTALGDGGSDVGYVATNASVRRGD